MSDNPTKFHVSLHVKDLGASVAFYGRILGVAPVKYFSDYAKFEVEDPGLVLSLEQATEGAKPGLNHLGVKLTSRNELIEWTSKAAERGLEFQHLDNVACCYANQSKIFMNDPDGVLFEVYNVNKDIAPEEKANKSPAAASACEVGATSYEHVLPGAFPTRVDTADGTLTKVALRGTLNADVSDKAYFEILAECYRTLAPGGELVIHMLAADVEATGNLPLLPEPASHVRRIPSETLIWDLVREAGFVGLEAQRLSPHHVFEFKGSKYRELLLRGMKVKKATTGKQSVVYKGPFPEIQLETGVTLPRGKRTQVSGDDAALLGSPTYRDHFVFLNDAGQTCAN